jgi:Niemann-Pick C1 protein
MAIDATFDDRLKAGKCAMRGSCGKTSMFGAELPCPDSGKADEVSRRAFGVVC